MKKIILFILILTILASGIFLYIQKKVDTNLSPSGDDLPVLDVPRGNGTGSAGPLNLVTGSGEEFLVPNFLDSSLSIEDQNNANYYFIGHDFPSIPEDSQEFVIEYQADTQFFNIIILEEPLAASRIKAEEYLKDVLGLEEEQMCLLNYTVGVPRTVNEYFAGYSFGFSFCPGSVEL